MQPLLPDADRHMLLSLWLPYENTASCTILASYSFLHCILLSKCLVLSIYQTICRQILVCQEKRLTGVVCYLHSIYMVQTVHQSTDLQLQLVSDHFHVSSITKIDEKLLLARKNL